MYLITVTAPSGDEFISLGKTIDESVNELIESYKAFFNMTENDLDYDHGYKDFESYFVDYLGIEVIKINSGESYVRGYGKRYKNGKEIR